MAFIVDQTEKIISIKFIFTTIVVGIGAGILGMSLAMLLHLIQHMAYGYSLHQIVSEDSFLFGVSQASPERRLLALTLCGFVAGFGWWALYTYFKPLVSIAEALKTGKKMPMVSTVIHALLQISTIALGSPLGREVAPRELGALFATWVTERMMLSITQNRILIACGAGAGLAAVYNVPLGGTVFICELLMSSFAWSVLLPAMVSCALATLISWWGLGNASMYTIPELSLTPSLLVWSVVTGPIFGYVAHWFMRIASQQRDHALHDRKMILACLCNFFIIGCFSIYFPAILGNGKSPVELELSAIIPLQLSAILFILRCLVVWSSLRVGAQGGLLTPSLANGALLGAVLGSLWNWLWPNPSFEAFALIGATAFLATAQKMPLTAIILIFEFTHLNLSFLVPLLLAVASAVATAQWCRK